MSVRVIDVKTELNLFFSEKRFMNSIFCSQLQTSTHLGYNLVFFKENIFCIDLSWGPSYFYWLGHGLAGFY